MNTSATRSVCWVGMGSIQVGRLVGMTTFSGAPLPWLPIIKLDSQPPITRFLVDEVRVLINVTRSGTATW